ncbi:MAG: hypothetical protein K2I27_03455 [Bacteroides sp.]|nr:hypothetical protein [Bacteroides sp.]
MKRIGIITLLCTLFSCAKGQELSCNNMTADSLNIELTAIKDTARKSLNDIRFEGWKEQDWLDNEYIRTLRAYLDDFHEGKIDNPPLEPYKELVKSKFVIYYAEAFMLGGVLIYVTFLDMPKAVFSAWVYSDVNEEKEVVSNYVVRYMMMEEEKTTFTKEEILQILKEDSVMKLW